MSHIRFLTRAWRNGWQSTLEKQWPGVCVVIQLSVKTCSLTSPVPDLFTGKSAAEALDAGWTTVYRLMVVEGVQSFKQWLLTLCPLQTYPHDITMFQ